MTAVKSSKGYKIVIIGSGNVATHLAKVISNSRVFHIIQVFSPTASHAKRLGQKLSIPFTSVWSELSPAADIYILAVKDDVIPECVKKLRSLIRQDAMVIHTSGTLDTSILKNYFKRCGVLYPLQSFSMNKKIAMGEIPVFITAGAKNQVSILSLLAKSISNDVKLINDDTRSVIHLAAVMANNFPNLWYSMAQRLLQTKKIDFMILLPLIEETTSKLKYLSPMQAQTGPARRNDQKVIDYQKKLLKRTFPEWLDAYKIMTLLIQGNYK